MLQFESEPHWRRKDRRRSCGAGFGGNAADRQEAEVREMAAFALGEIESAGGAYALVTVLKDPNKPARARSVEALGKITAALAGATASQTGADKKEDERLTRSRPQSSRR
jgi:HEAT repeat protein